MLLFPAIDLMDGQAVRLTKGDYATKQIYDADPVARALSFAKEGATHLHLVDLDGAKSGKTENAAVISKICQETGMFVEVGGGIRDEERIRYYLQAGAARCILGTVAAEDPAFTQKMIETYGDKIAVGIDTKNGKVATRGWLTDAGLDGVSFAKELEKMGLSAVIWTDIDKDGMLSGCNLPLYAALAKELSLSIVASGGVTTKEEIVALRKAGCGGAILGKALYEGRITLEEALQACKEDGTC